jgi:large subunit ribosomal protein L10
MNRSGPFQKALATDAIAEGRGGPKAPSITGVDRIGSRRRRDVDRTEKRAFVQAMQAVFAETSFVLVSQNKGLTVADATTLRNRMREAGATYKVAKNRLASLALEGSSFKGIQPLLKGPTALAWSRDPVAVAKTAVEFARTNDKFVILGGALGAQTLNAEGVKALAELPSLETLRAQLLGLIQTPATRIAGVLQAPGSQLARVFSAYAKKDETAEAA